MSELREFDLIPLLRAARYLVEKPKAAIRSRRKEHVDKTIFFVGSVFAGDPVSRKKHDGMSGADWEPHSEIWIHTLELGSAVEAEFYAVVKGSQVGPSLRSKWMWEFK